MTRVSVNCPRCATPYQVDPDLRGRRMRCPNALCQHVFEIPNDGDATSPGTVKEIPASPNVGAVGDVVPMLAAELAPAPAPSTTQAATSPPTLSSPAPAPERKRPRRPVSPPAVSGPTDAEILRQFQEMAGVDEGAPPAAEPIQPPPVRNRERTATEPTHLNPAEGSESPAFRGEEPAEAGTPTYARPAEAGTATLADGVRKRRTRGIIMVLAIMLVAGVSAGAWFVLNRRADVEQERAAHADAALKKGDYAEAAAEYRQLLGDFPDSAMRQHYLFHAELCSVLDAVYAPLAGYAVVQTLGRLHQFAQVHAASKAITRHQDELWKAARKLALQALDLAEEKKETPLLNVAAEAWDAAVRLRDGQADSPREARDIRTRLERLRTVVKDRGRRDDAIARLRALPPNALSVREARTLISAENLGNDSEAMLLVADLVKRHAQSVAYEVASSESVSPDPVDDAHPTLVFAPALPVPPGATPPSAGEMILAAARGVLYAVEPRTGAVVWARRLGADSPHVPVRLPRTAITPEAALCVSADQQRVFALAMDDGALIWQHRLSSPCVTTPLVIGKRVLLPTLAGTIEEVHAEGGQLHGSYKLGQRLTTAGVRLPDSDLAFFAADEFCLYVLDVARRECVGVLYTGHSAGSLRTPPVVVGADYLVLAISDSDRTILQSFELPIANPEQSPAAEVSLEGMCWFPTYQDGESLAQISDVGQFAVYGVRQRGNRDPILFPIYEQQSMAMKARQPSPALLVHADAERYWVLSLGRLQMLERKLPQKGPLLAERWATGLSLGTPLHGAHVQRDGERTTLFLTTQAESSPAVHLTAVDATVGRVLWQRQLGVMAAAEPIAFGDRVLLREDNSVCLIDLAAEAKPFLLADCHRLQLPGDGETHVFRVDPEATVLAHIANKSMTIITATKEGIWDETRRRTLELSAHAGGPPAPGDRYLVVPLMNGILERVSLADGGERVHGPNWRSARANDDSRAFALALGGDEFLISDGDRGLRIIHWPEPKSWEKKAAVELATTIVAPPAIVPIDDARGIVVGESSGITLLSGATLTPIRSWQMPGRITAGPFVRDRAIGCVVDNKRLVWIDPTRDTPSWEYAFVADIVGEPELRQDHVIVATTAGQFITLDRMNGRPVGDGYTLRANAAAVVQPLPLADGRLFAPLSDGTAMVIRP